jgi:sphinganine-1-phosphate aldolase
VQLQELLARRGWHYACLIKPPALHFVLTQQHVNGLDAMKSDLLAACDELRAAPAKAPEGRAKVYGSAASISDRGLVAELLLDYQDAMLDAE